MVERLATKQMDAELAMIRPPLYLQILPGDNINVIIR